MVYSVEYPKWVNSRNLATSIFFRSCSDSARVSRQHRHQCNCYSWAPFGRYAQPMLVSEPCRNAGDGCFRTDASHTGRAACTAVAREGDRAHHSRAYFRGATRCAGGRRALGSLKFSLSFSNTFFNNDADDVSHDDRWDTYRNNPTVHVVNRVVPNLLVLASTNQPWT